MINKEYVKVYLLDGEINLPNLRNILNGVDRLVELVVEKEEQYARPKFAEVKIFPSNKSPHISISIFNDLAQHGRQLSKYFFNVDLPFDDISKIERDAKSLDYTLFNGKYGRGV